MAGWHPPAIDVYGHFAIIIAQIAIVGPGAQVDPFADVAMPQKAVVVLVGVALDDAGFDLSANAAVRAERGAGADLGPQDVRVRADVTRTFQPCKSGDHGLAIDQHRPRGRIDDDHWIKPCRGIEQQAIAWPDHGESCRPPAREMIIRELVKVLAKHFAIELYEIPEVLHNVPAGF